MAFFIDSKMKQHLLVILALFSTIQAQPSLTPVVEFGGGCNFFWLNEGFNRGTVFHPTYRFSAELGLGIDTSRSLFLPSLGVMLDETKAMHNDKEIAKKYFVIYGGIGYEYKVDENWSFGLKGTFGIGKIYDWQVRETGTKTSGRTLEEELKEMETERSLIGAIHFNVGYRVTPHFKLKMEMFFSGAHDFYDGDWFYSKLREKTVGFSFSVQYLFSSK